MPTRFHGISGQNIKLQEGKTVAVRIHSFAHALSFSEKPLSPGEIFLIEIEKNEGGWSGHLRIGLTQREPSRNIELPQYALPDLANMGKTWILAVTKSHNRVYIEDVTADWPEKKPYASILGDDQYIHSSRGSFHRSLLKPEIKKLGADGEETDNLLPTDVGSRIGVMYVVDEATGKAEMHFIINGEDQGPCARDIPYRDAPLYAVVDVYGTTKQVRIIQLNYTDLSLQQNCRDVIRRHLAKIHTGRNNDSDIIESLPLPRKIKEYLRYEI